MNAAFWSELFIRSYKQEETEKMYVFRYKEFKEAEASKSIIPVIAPQLRIPSSKVEDLQLCYSVQVPSGKQQINLKDYK